MLFRSDLDMFFRIILAGSRICYLPSALVWHRHRADIQALGEQLYSYGYGLGAYLAKRVINRDLSAGILGRAIRESGMEVSRLKQASQASELGAVSKRLALNEAFGVAVGALSYSRAARRAAKESSGVQ